MEQLALLPEDIGQHQACPSPDPNDYDRIVVFFSGGKDSVACVLRLLDLGVSPNRIELHHHKVDGEAEPFMDWPVTAAYCEAFAKHFEMSLLQSWRVGGFEREMLRDNAATAPVCWQRPDGSLGTKGGDGPPGTRQRFPQVSPDLSVRWCSSYLKIDVGARVLTNEPRFAHCKTLVVTGERAEESAARANYRVFEPHRADNRTGKARRWVDHWRPVHGHSTADVWALIERHRVNPHPAYWLGWGRTSCVNCIFGNARQFASAKVVVPEQHARVDAYERKFGVTIKRKHTLEQLIANAEPYPMEPYWIAIARASSFKLPIVLENWTLPPGAFAEGCGPT